MVLDKAGTAADLQVSSQLGAQVQGAGVALHASQQANGTPVSTLYYIRASASRLYLV